MSTERSIIGIGNALMDIVVKLPNDELLTKYNFPKGSMILVEGRLKTRTWQNQQGQTMRTTEIIGERIQLGPKPMGQGQSKENPSSPKNDLPEINIDEEEITAEDLPF